MGVFHEGDGTTARAPASGEGNGIYNCAEAGGQGGVWESKKESPLTLPSFNDDQWKDHLLKWKGVSG